MNSTSENSPLNPVNKLLFMAASAGVEAAVRLHIARGDNLECRDKRGFTPLMIAASRDRANICRLLLQAGVDASTKDLSGRDALTLARVTASNDAAQTIAEHLAKLAIAASPDCDSASKPKPEPAASTRSDLASAQDSAIDIGSDELLPSHSSILNFPSGEIEEPVYVSISADASPSTSPMLETASAPDAAISPDEEARHSEKESRCDNGSDGFESAEPEPPPLEDEPGSSFESLFGDWEPLEVSAAPQNDVALVSAEAMKQRLIDTHIPIDNSADWNDFEADLPEFARPLPRADDADFRGDLRRILLLASREGSVPRVAIEDLLSERGDAEARNHDAEMQLRFVIGDLGAELDERLELEVGTETFKVFVDPTESSAEERELDAAVEFFDALRFGSNNPLRIYLKSMPTKLLSTAEREATIAKTMEAAVERALDALSHWPEGLKALLAAVKGTDSGPAQLSSVLATSHNETGSDGANLDAAEDKPAAPESSEWASADPADGNDTDFVIEPAVSLTHALGVLANIRELVDPTSIPTNNSSLIREHLGVLTFRRPFLLQLADSAPGDQTPEAKEYRNAIADLVLNRNEMTTANLRLVYATAKRYFHSGVPLDDLIQEGNIGLLKAVDRFDWRRGFKFSTMAVWWIKQQIGRSIPDFGFGIRPPVHVYDRTSKLYHESEAFERMNGRPPTPTERATLLGVSVQRMEMLTRPSSEPLSFDDVTDQDGFDLDTPPDPVEIIADKQIARLISERLALLDPKPEAVVRMRMGIGGEDPQTLEQIGVRLDVTRERIRQIESKALRVLSSFSSREELALATGRALPKRTLANITLHPTQQQEASEGDGIQGRTG